MGVCRNEKLLEDIGSFVDEVAVDGGISPDRCVATGEGRVDKRGESGDEVLRGVGGAILQDIGLDDGYVSRMNFFIVLFEKLV